LLDWLNHFLTLDVHVTDNFGVSLTSIVVYEKGKSDSTIDGASWTLGLTQGDNKNEQWSGEYTFGDNVPDGEYEVKFFVKPPHFLVLYSYFVSSNTLKNITVALFYHKFSEAYVTKFGVRNQTLF
jgi:hypothetical protein